MAASTGMKALVTGGAGFIGSHLAEALANEGVAVEVVDDFSLGSPQNLSRINRSLPVTLHHNDIRDLSVLRKAMSGCRWVFHLAALPSVPRSIEKPLESHSINLDATVQLLQMARELEVERFIFASSSAIYGESDAPMKQEQLPPSPLSPYALQKYAAERYGQLFHQFYGLAAVSLRYFNVFGPRQSIESPYAGVIARFCRAALNDTPPQVHGDGQQSRDFTYIDNVISANLSVARAPIERVAGKVFNVAGGESVSLLSILSTLSRLTGREVNPVFHPNRPGDIRHSKADIRAAHEAFGYQPSVHWSTGLSRTLEWYRENTKP